MKRLLCVSVLIAALALVGYSFAETAGFTVTQHVVCTGVEDREPVGVGEAFPADSQVYSYLSAANIAEDTEVTFIWYHEGSEMLRTALPLRSGPRWRTYANKNLMGLKGAWKVDIQAADGSVASSVSFMAE